MTPIADWDAYFDEVEVQADAPLSAEDQAEVDAAAAEFIAEYEAQMDEEIPRLATFIKDGVQLQKDYDRERAGRKEN